MSRCKFSACSAMAAVALLLLPGHAWSQNPTFNIEGVVTDAQQATLPGVVITITNTATGLTRTVTTTENGRFVVRALPPEGRYRVQAEIAGFANQVRQDLVFNAGQNVVLNFTMQLSTVQETVTVAGDAPIVSTTSSEVASTIDRAAFETLPVKERNYFRLLTLDSNRASALRGIRRATRSGPCAAASVASRNSTRSSPSSRAASAGATAW